MVAHGIFAQFHRQDEQNETYCTEAKYIPELRGEEGRNFESHSFA